MNLTLSNVNKTIAGKLNQGQQKIYKYALDVANQEPGTQTPGGLFLSQEKINQAIDTNKLLYSLGLTANQTMSDAVKQFIEGLSGTNVHTLA